MDLYKSTQAQLAPDLVKTPTPTTAGIVADSIESIGKNVTAGLGVATVNTAQEAVQLGEIERERLAMSGLDQYKNTMYKAASAQDRETFGRFYSEAQRLRAATMQGIMKPSEAQIRLSALEKDLSYAHPHLASELRTASSAVSGNASQLLNLVKEDPAAKAMEQIFTKAMEDGMTPAEYMSRNRRMKMREEAQAELKYASDLRAYSSQEYTAQLGRIWGHSNFEVGIAFTTELEQVLRQAGGQMTGADAAAMIQSFKAKLRSERMQEINGIVANNPNLDMRDATKMLDDQLAWLDDMANTYKDGKSFTFEHLKSLQDWQKKSLELADHYDLRALTSGMPPLMGIVARNNPAALIPMAQSAVQALAAGEIGRYMSGDPGFRFSNPEVALAAAWFGDEKTGGLRHLLGVSASVLTGLQPSPGTGDPIVDNITGDYLLKTWDVANTPDQRGPAAASLWRSAEMSVVKAASSNKQSLFIATRSDPSAYAAFRERAANDVLYALFSSGDITPDRFQVGGGDPVRFPIQMKAGTTPSSKSNKALADANSVLRAYQVIDPNGYGEFLKELGETLNPPTPKGTVSVSE